ncbi:MAG: RNA methyltransferase [Bdellovibrionaceae bacterium]|nr:RNA methyltransferase [Pseudobdellovibrionaceae bacterium]
MADKKLRFIVGLHACMENVRVAPQHVREFYVSHMDQVHSPEWHELLRSVKVKPKVKPTGFFKEMAEGHQGIAIGSDYWPKIKTPGATSRVVLLDGIEDPHNLGAIIRTSWLMNVDAIYVTERRSVKLTPTVHKVASGGCEHVPIEEANLQVFIKELKEQGYWVYSFSDKTDTSIYQTNFNNKTALVFGNEEKGVRIPVIRECDGLLKIPQAQEGPSYNVSVSVGIALSELNRQIGWS